MKKLLSLLLLAFITLPLVTAVACSMFGSSSLPQPTLTMYINDQFGYSIGYPNKDWEVGEENKKQVYLIPYSPYKGHVRISVLENNTLPVSEVAKRWLFAITQTQDGVVFIDMVEMKGLWDQYLSYDYISNWGEGFHAEAFLKQVGTRVYLIETAGEQAKYTEYPFTAILGSFKLSPEKTTK